MAFKRVRACKEQEQDAESFASGRALGLVVMGHAFGGEAHHEHHGIDALHQRHGACDDAHKKKFSSSHSALSIL